MKTRQDHIDFDRNYCTHYAPLPGVMKGDYCALQCGAKEKMDAARKDGRVNMSPCIGGHIYTDVRTLCPKWERRSLEHAEARADSILASLRRMEVVMPVVAQWRTWTPTNKVDKSGVIECPECKGRLHLSQSAYNGHVWGKCETNGCVKWME